MINFFLLIKKKKKLVIRCSGGSLQEDVDYNGVYTEGKTAMIMQQLLSGVNHMHKKFISHRDLKVKYQATTLPLTFLYLA